MDFLYDEAKYRILTQQLNLTTATVKMLLVSDTYTPDPTQQFVSESNVSAVSEHEVEGTGYQSGFGGTGRKTLTGKIWIKDTTLHVVRFLFDPVSWLGINLGVVAGAVLIAELGTSDTGTLLIAYRSSGGFPQLTDGNELRVEPNASLGYFYI